MGPKFSIITSCYNSEETIEATLKSVLDQTYSNIEYIIVDGLSSDNTIKIVEEYKNGISKIISEKDKGIYDALNKGIEAATGDVIGFLHSDDIFNDIDVVQNMADLFEDQDPDAIYADLVYVNRENTDKITRYWKSKKYKDGMFLNGWMPPHPTFYVKKTIYDKYGKFNLKLRSAADYEIMLRFIHKHKIKLSYLPKVSIKMRVGGMSTVSLSNRLKANREDRMAWSINNIKPRFYTILLKPISKISQFLKS